MKLLKVKATHFKNCKDDVEISFVPIANKNSEDKMYELNEIADELYVFNTISIVGKNASGKTTALDLLNIAYRILGAYRLSGIPFEFSGTELELFFYHNGSIYRYRCTLDTNQMMEGAVNFSNQQVMYKTYYKTNHNEIFDDKDFAEYKNIGTLPSDTSALFFVLGDTKLKAIFFGSVDGGFGIYENTIRAMSVFNISYEILMKTIRLFDENISDFKMLDPHNYEIKYCGQTKVMTDKELFFMLSSGTTKGMYLYVMAVAALKEGIDLVVDEIENHFHKTLVENLISLFKDKKVNKNGATLIFSTHYCELLDKLGRQDSIYISKAEDKIYFENMYSKYGLRPEVLKSKQFYNNAFNTGVNYEALMDLKMELMK